MSENPKIPRRRPPLGPPPWLKVFVVVFIALVLLVVVLHLMGFGFGGHSTGKVLPDAHNTWLIEHVIRELSV